MKENLSNVGKKEQRQINQLLDKQAKEGRQGVRDVKPALFPSNTDSTKEQVGEWRVVSRREFSTLSFSHRQVDSGRFEHAPHLALCQLFRGWQSTPRTLSPYGIKDFVLAASDFATLPHARK